MEITSIINQYYDAFITKYGGTVLPGHLKAMNAICSCRTPDSGALAVIMENGNLCPVDTAVAHSVRTMKPANGLTDNSVSYYLFCIL